MFGEISIKGSVPHAISPYPELIESELDRSKQKGLKFQHVCSQDYRDWNWSLGLNKTMGVVTYLSTLGSTLKIIWCELVGRIVSGLIDIDPCSKTAKIHQGSRWQAIWLAGGCGRASAMCLIVYNVVWQREILNIELPTDNLSAVYMFSGWILMPFSSRFTCACIPMSFACNLNGLSCTRLN